MYLDNEWKIVEEYNAEKRWNQGVARILQLTNDFHHVKLFCTGNHGNHTTHISWEYQQKRFANLAWNAIEIYK